MQLSKAQEERVMLHSNCTKCKARCGERCKQPDGRFYFTNHRQRNVAYIAYCNLMKLAGGPGFQ